ncbi:hypothetical protein OX283_005075 [Flavobacterium sp. SUN052]|uniref:hypothetical protein n=1 Tax=Flavobacterium sp. SUN052 TaxID=3002441 RepID=UPI00237E5AB8|nr:hypothetical protein [Flavobacterium sp. SUN052]MEC4004017.1 hypothetical protein [Flavobacterium sp. SUN052]
MSTYKYVTPYWRDSQEILGEGIKAYTGTTFFILNYNNERADIKIHFYDLSGNLINDMEVAMLTPANSVLDMRIVDVISFKNPNYRFSNNLKTGSMRILCDVPLVVSGKMFNGKSTSAGTEDLNVWSIPFEEVKFVPIDFEKIGGPIPIPDNSYKEYFGRKRPGQK